MYEKVYNVTSESRKKIREDKATKRMFVLWAARYNAEESVEANASGILGYTERRFVQKQTGIRLSPPGTATTIASLEVVELGFQRLDGTMCHLQVFVETVPFGDKLWDVR